MRNIIEIDKLNLTLSGHAGNIHILHDISLTIHENTSVAIVGASGSGKTSLLMTIAGLERASAQQLNVCGEDLRGRSEDALARFRARNIGVIFQSFHLLPTMTALENVSLPLEFAGAPDSKATAEAALRALGLSHRLHHYPAELSGGEQQRVGIARAFAPRPKLLLADEPTGNLDHDTGEQVMKVLLDLQREYGATLMLITHDMGIASRCDRIIRIADGRIVPEAAAA